MAVQMIKDIVVSLSTGTRDVAGDYALSVAEAFAAHLAAVAFAYDPMVRPPVRNTTISGLIEAERVRSEHAAQAGVARIDAAARRSGLSVETRVIATSLAGASDVFGRMARRFDLSVVGQPEPDTVAPEDPIIEAALFESGRPVIVVPYIQKSGLTLERVMVCWDGSRAAARAVGDAMPLLGRAKRVEVVLVTGEPAKRDEEPGADIAAHLARHGANVTLERIASIDGDVAATLLSQAADAGADFIVMGGYGRAHWREFVLGGTTRAMLASLTLPTLMSH
jgi:nucleotide-binding universal stress UspA family protein